MNTSLPVLTDREPPVEELPEPARLAAQGDGGRLAFDALYVHVPFCVHKCHYCDFYSITRQTAGRMSAFVDRILAEAEQWAPHVVTGRIRTVFFGGGTPSLLPLGLMLRLIDGLKARLDLTAVREFTIECNPATVDAAWLAGVREAGADRLSFGAQSFHPRELKVLERHHDPDDVPRSLDLARSAGFSRLSLDLIYGIPGQTLDDWAESLRRALACATTHLSAYLLTYEPNTPLAVRRRLGQVTPLEESLELSMLAFTRRTLAEAGMPAYEISNFAAAGQACRHNLNYWLGGSYLGLGPSAASHWHGWRWRNRPHLGEWEAAVDGGRLPAVEVERLSPTRQVAERAYLGLRLSQGVLWTSLGEGSRQRFGPFVERYRRSGLLDADDEGFRLTEAGVAVADGLSAELLTL